MNFIHEAFCFASFRFVPVFFDEAGHRVATQYLLSALGGHFSANQLRNYRRGHSLLPGHPELGTPGVKFASGRHVPRFAGLPSLV